MEENDTKKYKKKQKKRVLDKKTFIRPKKEKERKAIRWMAQDVK